MKLFHRRPALLAAAACAALLCLPAATPAGAATPPITHIWTIVLENADASSTFGPKPPAPYLARTLTGAGAFVPNYYGIGHLSLDNYVAMISGQAPNFATQADCPIYADFAGALGAGGQAMGLGCVYPAAVKTIADQLTAAGSSWRGYEQSMGADPAREAATCGHPALNSQDKTQSASATDQYAARHDPFVYFHSIIDNAALCNANVVPLDRLASDLAAPSSTPSYSLVTPDLCADGHDATCADPSRPGGYAGIDDFLATWVPRIAASQAFKAGGLIAIVFDEASNSDAKACCGEQPGPNTPAPGGSGPGGGRTGAVLLSPFIQPGSTTQTSYNHYSLLRSSEDLLGLGHLGFAGATGLTAFGDDIFNAQQLTNVSALVTPGGAGTPGGRNPNSGSRGKQRRPACAAGRLPRRVHGRFKRGAILRQVRVIHRRGRRTKLRLRATRPANVSVRVVGSHGLRTILTSVRGCRRYSLSLPSRHGKLVLRARVGRGIETRRLRF